MAISMDGRKPPGTEHLVNNGFFLVSDGLTEVKHLLMQHLQS